MKTQRSNGWPASRWRWVAGIVVATAVAVPHVASAQSPQTINCGPGQVYRDDRSVDGPGEERCVRLLPGSFWVNDGPFKFWDDGKIREEGVYRDGRKMGAWKECDRFNRCRQQQYELPYPGEVHAGFKQEIPVSYVNGKYIFDFASCWATWVTRETEDSFLELNVGGRFGQCQITYIPENKDGSTKSTGYFCRVPFEVGARQFDTLDFMREFPRQGLPQFCEVDPIRQPDGRFVSVFSRKGPWLLKTFPP